MDILGSNIDEKDIIKLSGYYSKSYTESVNLYGGHNFIYLIKSDGEFVLRATQTKRRSMQDIESELDFMSYLKSGGVSLAAPIKGLDGKFTYETELFNENFIISAFEKSNGLKCWDREGDGREQFIAAGKMLGKMHNAAKKYNPQNIKPRKQWYENYHLENAKEVFAKYRPDLTVPFESYMKKIHELPRDNDTFGLIHSDYFFSNYLFNNDNENENENEITIIDFDECEYSWFISDIALCIYYFVIGPDPHDLDKRYDEAAELFSWIIEGYTQENKLNAKQFENIDYFFQMRDYILLSTIYENNRFRECETAFVEDAAERVIKNKKFVDVDFVKLI